jgi:hypothetical protein
MRTHQPTRPAPGARSHGSAAAALRHLVGSLALGAGSILGGLAFAGGLSPRAALAVDYESHVVTIDASSPYPVPTGFVPADSTGDVIILSEGSTRVLEDSNRYDLGWFGPNGMTRLEAFGQPIANGMSYGALIGGFSTDVADFRFVGRIGAYRLSAAEVGQELHLALNIPESSLSSLEGQVKVTVIYVAEGYADRDQFEITEGTTLPVATGMIAAADDQFVILPYGRLDTGISNFPYTGGDFAPEGLASFNRSGQPYSEGPYGGLYAHYNDAANGFYLGDGGMWRVNTAAGQELRLTLNLDPADLVGSDGSFIVNVIRIPL